MVLARRALVAALAVCGCISAAKAEISEVVLGQQFGAVYLPQMVMESEKLVEKHLAAAGMGDVKVRWAKLGGPAALNDAMISGSLHFAAQGVPSLAVIWDRTRTNIQVKALGANANNNIWLNTKNPNVKSLKDFTEKDRIAIPSLKVSTQALLLQRASAQFWGPGKQSQLEPIIVALAHPDALAAVTNPGHEITTHFATSPFHEGEMKVPGIHTVTTAYDIMGGPFCGLTFTSNEKFRKENPKVFAAVSKAFDESFEWINADKRRGAKRYIELAKEKRMTEDELTKLISSPDMQYTKVPKNVGKVVDFMHTLGTVKTKAASWKELFFAEVHSLPGS